MRIGDPATCPRPKPEGRPQRRPACDVAPLMQRTAEDPIFNPGTRKPSPFHRVFNGVGGQMLRGGCIERSAIGATNRSSCGRYDDGVAHSGYFLSQLSSSPRALAAFRANFNVWLKASGIGC